MNAEWTLEKPYTSARTPGVMALGSLLFAVLTAVGGAVSFPLPFSPVPITMQSFFTVLAGVVLGPVWGAVSQVLYLGAGLIGAPVFAGGAAGPGVLAGPTGGYLVGFVAGAWLAGWLAGPGASWLRLALALLAGHAAVFVCGVSHLLLFTAQSVDTALRWGLIPFLPGTALKVAGALALARSRMLCGWFRS
jgi:biotin transport system substrate-specific component